MTANPAFHFDESKVWAAFAQAAPRVHIEHIDSCSSTNTLLLERAAQGAHSGLVLVTDEQTAGKGRQGRRWISTPDYSLTFSLLWIFPDGGALSGLSLAVGVAIARGLEDLGIEGIALKWPNDIWLSGRKLGGVLIEVLFSESRAAVVIGIGLNLRRNPAWDEIVDQPLAAIADARKPIPREQVLGAVLLRLQEKLDAFAAGGFAAVRAEWDARNALADQWVRVESQAGEQVGLCIGSAANGALEIQDEQGQRHHVTAGDVGLKVRPLSPPYISP